MATGWEAASFAVSLGSEIFLGAAMGFAIRLMLSVIDVVGTVLAANCGLGMAMQFDPVTQSQGLIVSRLVQTAGFLVFLALDLHHEVLIGLVGSFSVAPPGQGGFQPLLEKVFARILLAERKQPDPDTRMRRVMAVAKHLARIRQYPDPRAGLGPFGLLGD